MNERTETQTTAKEQNADPLGSSVATGYAFKPFDLIYALGNAAEFLENEEWPEDDGGAQEAANREAAKRIRRMAQRYGKKQKA